MNKIFVGSIIAANLLFATNSAEININSNTLELIGEYNLNTVYQLNDDSNYYLTISFLSSEESSTSVSTQKLITGGLKMVNPYIDDRGLSLGMGAKIVWADNTNKNFIATPLNIFAKYEINEQISINFDFAYAPKILTFSDGESYKETNLKANYKVLENGYVYLGGRSITTDYKKGGSVDYDKSIFFGYKVQF
jgi:lipopolysaccharide assembly outer membrane protein LptD (OstA)